jgi:MFS family permease
MSDKESGLLQLAPLFLVLLIDSMGLGLLFPILNSLIMEPSAGFVLHASASARSIVYGVTVGIFMLSWFFGAAILGDLSDLVGRKKSLVICMLGAAVGYILAAFAIPMKSLLLLILGRVVAGFTAGSQPIAQAAIVDVSPEEHKARNIGWILLAVSVGFVLGPIFGGLLSNPHLISWFGYTTPLWFAALLSVLNAFILRRYFKETFRAAPLTGIKWHRAIAVFISAFKHAKIRYISIAFLVMILGWSNYFTFMPMFMLMHYGYNELWNSLFLTVMACGFAIGCYSVDYFNRWMGLKWTVALGLLVSGALSYVIVSANILVLHWLCNFVIGIFIAAAYSALLTIFSNQVSADEQGWVMGVTGSIMALAFALTSFLTGAITRYGMSLPIILAAIGLFVSGLLMIFYRMPLANQANETQGG